MSERTEHGFRSGAIEAIALFDHERGSAIRLQIVSDRGTARIDVQATRGGRKVYITIGASDSRQRIEVGPRHSHVTTISDPEP